MLDYILYQVGKPKVSLKKEVYHIEEYIELEKIRFQDSLKVKFTSDEIPETVQIAPMVLIPFVENAFKHGSIIDGFLRIEIVIKFSDNTLVFSIKNTTLRDDAVQESKGIGLKNIKKKLQKVLYIIIVLKLYIRF